MTMKKTVILALGAAASLFFAPIVVGSLKGEKLAHKEDTMMMKGGLHGENQEDCPCAKAGKKCECKSGDCKSSCGGEGLNERCVEKP